MTCLCKIEKNIECTQHGINAVPYEMLQSIVVRLVAADPIVDGACIHCGETPTKHLTYTCPWKLGKFITGT